MLPHGLKTSHILKRMSSATIASMHRHQILILSSRRKATIAAKLEQGLAHSPKLLAEDKLLFTTEAACFNFFSVFCSREI